MRAVGQVWQRWKLEALAQIEGSEIVELAVSVPLLVLIVIGLTDFGGAFNTKFKLTGAVREGARFASNESTADLSNATPASISAVRDVVDTDLVAVHINDCGLSAASPTKLGFKWTYTANTGCPGTLTLVIDRGSFFTTSAGTSVRVEATHVKIQYPYQWHFTSVMRLFVPSATSPSPVISAEAFMQNLN
jgi:Flp pilus assembly protein TadG